MIDKFNSSNNKYKLNFDNSNGKMNISMPGGKSGHVDYEKSKSAPNLN